MRIQPPGRPRVEGPREAEILSTTLTLLIRHGYDRLTMDAVAREARTSKATLYRRWTSKQQLVMDAIVNSKAATVPPPPDTGSLKGDLMAAYAGSGGVADVESVGMLAAVLTAMETDPEFARQVRGRLVEPRIEQARVIFGRAVERGEVADDVDAEFFGTAMAGIVLYRTFLLGVRPDRDSVERVLDQIVLRALGMRT